jgi:Protein of unknown function (DUF1566)
MKTLLYLSFFLSLCRGGDVLLRSEVECRLSIDGAPRGIVKTGDGVRLNLPPGDHRIEAETVKGSGQWAQTIRVSNEPQTIRIPLHAGGMTTWVDPQTGLTWTGSDNGLGLSLRQAERYCRVLSWSGFNDWTLPSIDDLQSIFGGAESQGGYHVRGPLKLTGWQWSSTPGAQDGEGWAFDFGDGGRASVAAGDSGLNRAVCVRGHSPN